jgi:hypothetical protein
VEGRGAGCLTGFDMTTPRKVCVGFIYWYDN